MSTLLPAGDANLDGVVDSKDEAIVAADQGHDRSLVGTRRLQPRRRRQPDRPGDRSRTSGPIADTGFEQVQVGAGQYQYRPTGSPWTFAGHARHRRQRQRLHRRQPAAPEGTQVAFLQMTGSISQTTGNWVAGNYVLTFDAAQRGNYQASQQDFQVLVDGVVVGTFTPSGHPTRRTRLRCSTSTAGSHTITFQGLDTAGGDNTAFIDSSRAQVNQLADADAGLEQVQVGAGHFQYRPTGSPWTFAGTPASPANNSGFTCRQPAGARKAPRSPSFRRTGSISQIVTGTGPPATTS